NTEPPSHHGMLADADKLVNRSAATHGSVILDHRVAPQHDPICQFRVVVNDAVMPNMGLYHDPIIVSDNGFASLSRSRIDGGIFTDNVLVTNFKEGLFPIVFHVLGLAPHYCPGEDTVFFTQNGKTSDNAMGADNRALSNNHV